MKKQKKKQNNKNKKNRAPNSFIFELTYHWIIGSSKSFMHARIRVFLFPPIEDVALLNSLFVHENGHCGSIRSTTPYLLRLEIFSGATFNVVHCKPHLYASNTRLLNMIVSIYFIASNSVPHGWIDATRVSRVLFFSLSFFHALYSSIIACPTGNGLHSFIGNPFAR